MFTHIEKIRVRYGETDKMGFVYHGNYALYYEVSRVELLRKLGINYNDVENSGIGLPVVKFEIDFFKPALYDEIISVEVSLNDKPLSRLVFYYKCYNEQNELLNQGKVILAFINLENKKPVKCPPQIENIFKNLH
ncbi:MAG: acyl-CoA thioesterase [Bacteroidetes bacterium]|nr:acyl-CoA thioesterase [Bacteroidota bacterium]